MKPISDKWINEWVEALDGETGLVSPQAFVRVLLEFKRDREAIRSHKKRASPGTTVNQELYRATLPEGDS